MLVPLPELPPVDPVVVAVLVPVGEPSVVAGGAVVPAAAGGSVVLHPASAIAATLAANIHERTLIRILLDVELLRCRRRRGGRGPSRAGCSCGRCRRGGRRGRRAGWRGRRSGLRASADVAVRCQLLLDGLHQFWRSS